MKYQRTEIEETELKKLCKNRMQPEHITGKEIDIDFDRPYIRIVKIDYEQGNKDKELLFELNIN